MNLFKLHDDLLDHEDQDLVPNLALARYRNNLEELKKREKLWARDPETAYYYALEILKGRFELSEKTIAKNAQYSYLYAGKILNAPFPLGELTIAKSPWYSYLYALYVLKARFELGEPTIINSDWRQSYEEHIRKIG